VQQVDPVGRAQLVEAGDRRPDRQSTGADNQLVVVQEGLAAVRVTQQQPTAGDVDVGGEGVQPQPHSGRLEVGVGTVREVAPVPDLPGHVVRDAADGEVRVGVGDHHGHLSGRVQLAGA